MSSGNTRKRVQELLNAPFRPKKSRRSSPSPPSASRLASSNTPANTLDTCNLGSASLTRASASSAHTLAGSAYVSPTIPVPMKNEAFQMAIHKYIDNLSDDDKVAFQSAADVMEMLGELPQGKSRISSSQMQKVQKVLRCVKQFSGSVIICIQHSPQISSLVMGGLNCILAVSSYPLITPFITYSMNLL